MADNVAITPGSGATVAADDIGGVLYQRVKPTIGADGTAVDISAGAGAVGTGVQRMTLASDDPAVTNLTSIVSLLQPSSDPLPVYRALRATASLTGLKITNAGASGDTTLVAAVAGQTTRVHRMQLSVAGATIVKVLQGTTELAVYNFAGNGAGVILDFAEEPWFITAANAILKINSSAAVQVDGRLEYVTSA